MSRLALASGGSAPARWLEEVYAHARAAYPVEACGIVTLALRHGALRVHPCRNIQDELRERDPLRHPRSARTGYYLDPADFLRVERAARAAGEAMVAVYHSHTDAGAYFSDLDRRQAAPLGEPLLPEVAYLVVSVIAGQVRESVLYAWDADLREYVDVELATAGA